jgi:hypothetical protein
MPVRILGVLGAVKAPVATVVSSTPVRTHADSLSVT